MAARQMYFICRAEHVASMDPLLRPALQKIYGCQPWVLEGLDQVLRQSGEGTGGDRRGWEDSWLHTPHVSRGIGHMAACVLIQRSDLKVETKHNGRDM